jgi:hypothetical protein
VRGQQDPAVPLDLDDPLVDADRPQPVENLDHLRGQHQTVPGGKAGDPLAMSLPLPDLRPQPLVDVRDRRGELLLVGLEQLSHPRTAGPQPRRGS